MAGAVGVAVHQDLLGDAIHVAEAASVAAGDDFAGDFIACGARVTNILAEAERHDSVTAQGCAAALHLVAESPEGPFKSRRDGGRPRVRHTPAAAVRERP